MRIWKGIERNTVSTDDASDYAQNIRFNIDGELQRRSGMEGFATNSGTTITSMRNGLGIDYGVFATSTGTFEAVLTP